MVLREGFYNIDDYSGKLPNQRNFPIQGATVMAVEGYPNGFTDKFIMDLSVSEKDKLRLDQLAREKVTKPQVDGLLEKANGATILLSEPQYIYDGVGLSYVLFTPDVLEGYKPVGIQVKYYRYFRNHYPKCEFYTGKDRMTMKVVRVGKKLVGLWMPVMLPPLEE